MTEFDWEAAKKAAERNDRAFRKEGREEIKRPRLAVEEEMKRDFRKFLAAIFKHLGDKVPTPVQYEIARYLQHGPSRKIIAAFRGVGKSWITVCYVLWRLYCDPQRKILVVSASASRAASFTNFALWLIREVKWLKHLEPGPQQRQSSKAFDVGPAHPDDSPSVRAAGITGQVTGSRADDIVADDMEIPQNAATALMREKLKENVKEFAAIIKPGGTITYLGTYQVEESLYIHQEQLGYETRIWPVLYPEPDRVRQYGHRLAPSVANAVAKKATLVGRTVEPLRFSDEDIAARRIEWGTSGFALQFMLDASLSDADRYELKLKNLIVMSLDYKRGPDSLSWGTDERLVHKTLPVLGFNKDRYHLPSSVSDTTSPWKTITAYLDPSGSGADEAALAIGTELHGRIFLLKLKAWRDGYAPETLAGIAEACVEWNVRSLRIESNFGQGMYAGLLQPHMERAWAEWNKEHPEGPKGATGIEEERATVTQKEVRIREALGPPSGSHRLVVNTQVIEEDWQSVQGMKDVEAEKRHAYSLAYQFSHLTLEKGCLAHDDRLDAWAGLVARYEKNIGINPDKSSQEAAKKAKLDVLKAFLADAKQVSGEKDGREGGRGRGAGIRSKATKRRF